MSQGINAGDLDREITLITGVKSQDAGTGEEVIVWDADVGEIVWAQWLPAGTREAWQAQARLGSYIEGVFKIYLPQSDVSPDGMRIAYAGRTYDTKPAVEIERGEGLLIPVVARGEGSG